MAEQPSDAASTLSNPQSTQQATQSPETRASLPETGRGAVRDGGNPEPVQQRPQRPAASGESFRRDANPSAQPRKPSYIRRPSASRPLRGKEFSVDDAREEVDEEDAARQARYTSGSSRRLDSTVRRRQVPAQRLATVESTDAEELVQQEGSGAPNAPRPRKNSSEEEGTLQADVDVDDAADADADESTDDVKDDGSETSDAESFTLKDRQDAINETHPFGIRIWKPALYKKYRSVEKGAEGDIHSTPGGMVPGWLRLFNLLWTFIFGWWLALLAGVGGLLCHLFAFAPGCKEYGTVLWGFALYILYPFGKYVKLIQEEAYAEEDHGEGRSITEYEQWQSGDIEEGRLFFGPIRSLVGRRRSDDDSEDEADPLLGRTQNQDRANTQRTKHKKRLFGRGQWTMGRVIFFIFFYGGLTPSLLLVSGICWLLVYTVPMARVTYLLFDHLRRRPLALEFHHDTTDIRGPRGAPPSSILLCTYRAVGTKYWKYTIGGTNIFLINFLGIVVFVIFDYFVLYVALGIENALTNTMFVFCLALVSIIPLAYFIGQAVASISAQSTMGVGAAVNAFFSTVVEVFLYCIALKEGKGQLVEGSIIGSIFAGILLLPGLSMCFGALKRKTQRFNVKSAGVTTTMLLFATLGAFGPTLFYQIYGAHELNCHDCVDEDGNPLDRDCRRCYFSQTPAIHDPFFINAVRPYILFAAILLFLSYIIGLFFTLRTHAAAIWESELDEKRADKPEPPRQPQKTSYIDYGATGTAGHAGPASAGRSDLRDSQILKKTPSNPSNQAGAVASAMNVEVPGKTPQSIPSSIVTADGSLPRVESPLDLNNPGNKTMGNLGRMSPEGERHQAMRQVPDTISAPAAGPRDQGETLRSSASSKPRHSTRKAQQNPHQHSSSGSRLEFATEDTVAVGQASGGGHDAPNWGRAQSYIVLITATVAYAIIAEILVDTVDSVLNNSDIDEKFLGITLFALVPNTTEFLNAISFAVNGNIALSMEIGSAYALQVCLLQIPALVLFSEIFTHFVHFKRQEVAKHTFLLIFPQWDMVLVILCVFLLSYMYGEGKSNYFKGSILILSYLVVLVGFYASSFDNGDDPGPSTGKPGSSTATVRRDMNSGRKVFTF